jgi:hypothetical protein
MLQTYKGKGKGKNVEKVEKSLPPKKLEGENFCTQSKTSLVITFFIHFLPLFPRILNPHKIQNFFLFKLYFFATIFAHISSFCLL